MSTITAITDARRERDITAAIALSVSLRSDGKVSEARIEFHRARLLMESRSDAARIAHSGKAL